MDILLINMSLLIPITVIFIIYEILKMLYPEKIVTVIKMMEKKRVIDRSIISNLIIELGYFVYVVALLFTRAWLPGLVMIIISIAVLIYDKRPKRFTKKYIRKKILIDSLLSIIILLYTLNIFLKG